MKRFFILLFFIFFTIIIQAQELSFDYLFINSHPIKAKVIIDGIDKGILTPCVIKNISSIQKNITIKKDGYTERVIKISEIKSKSIDVNLMTESIALFLPENNSYSIENSLIQGPVYVSNLKKGIYKINRTNKNIILKKQSNFLPSEIALATALGISTTYMFISIGLKEFYDFKSNSATSDFDTRHYNLVSRGFDISKYVSISITSILALALTGIVITDISIKNKNVKDKIVIETRRDFEQEKTLYESAVKLLANGEIERSNKVLQSLVLMYPDSEFAPLSFYQLGQNFYLLKDYKNALLNWEIFIKDYPIAKYYDYVIKNISEIYYTNGDIETAITYINKILFTEDILEREVVYSFKAKLFMESYLKTEDIEKFKLAENQYLSLIDNYKNSENLEFYFSMLVKLYKKSSDTEKLIKLKEKAEEIEDSKTKRAILSYF